LLNPKDFDKSGKKSEKEKRGGEKKN